jgi:hypothetical protein
MAYHPKSLKLHYSKTVALLLDHLPVRTYVRSLRAQGYLHQYQARSGDD